MNLYALILQPPGKAARGTLGVARPARHEGHPRGQTHAPRVNQPHHHPDEGLQMATISPLPLLTH